MWAYAFAKQVLEICYIKIFILFVSLNWEWIVMSRDSGRTAEPLLCFRKLFAFASYKSSQLFAKASFPRGSLRSRGVLRRDRDSWRVDGSRIDWIRQEQPSVCNRCEPFRCLVVCGAPQFLLLFSDVDCLSLFLTSLWSAGLVPANLALLGKSFPCIRWYLVIALCKPLWFYFIFFPLRAPHHAKRDSGRKLCDSPLLLKYRSLCNVSFLDAFNGSLAWTDGEVTAGQFQCDDFNFCVLKDEPFVKPLYKYSTVDLHR